MLGPRLQELQLRDAAHTVLQPRKKQFSALPYVMIAGTYVMLFLVLPNNVGGQRNGQLVARFQF